MKHKILRGLIGLFLVTIIVLVSWNVYLLNKPRNSELTTRNDPKLWVISDTHFIADSLHDEGKRFRYMEATAASKDLKYSTVVLKSFVKAALKQRPTAVIITGDVTFNGEKTSAETLAKIFSPLKKANINFLVIPGNHDIFDGWARSFKGNKEYRTAQISPSEWKHIFKDSYNQATSSDPNSLSYTIKLNNRYQLLLLDTNRYTVGTSNVAPITSGYVRNETMKWMKKQLAQAKKAGLRTISFTHHNLYQHSSRGKNGYVIENYDKVQKLYQKYDVKLNFAGHIHAQDIAKDPEGICPTVEVLNGSFAVSPNSYGELQVTDTELDYHKKILNITPYLTDKERKNPDLVNHQKYLKTLFFNETKAIMYDRIYYQTKGQPKVMDEAATAFAQINWHFFTGTDHFNNADVKRFEQSMGYKNLQKYGELGANYAKNALQDKNLQDNSLKIQY